MVEVRDLLLEWLPISGREKDFAMRQIVGRAYSLDFGAPRYDSGNEHVAAESAYIRSILGHFSAPKITTLGTVFWRQRCFSLTALAGQHPILIPLYKLECLTLGEKARFIYALHPSIAFVTAPEEEEGLRTFDMIATKES